MKTKIKAIIFTLITIVLGIYIFFEAPTLNPVFADGAFFWCAVISIYVIAYSLMKFSSSLTELFGGFLGGSTSSAGTNTGKKFKLTKISLIILAAVWAIFAIVMIASSVFFNSKAFRDQLQISAPQKFTSQVQAVDTNQIPIVDKALAYKLADRNLGAEPSLGSQVDCGEPVIQMVDGKLVWVVPLNHSGFFKWINNLSGTPGYIIVSATNENDVKYVRNFKVKYQQNNFLLDDVKRKVRFGKGLFRGITDMSFELDDSGQPYWVVTTYKNLRGFSLPEANGVIILNATTGESEYYPIDKVPSWVDRVQPEDFIINQINNNGKYIHGIFNFSDKEKYKASEGHAIIYNEGKCYLFTGVTSVGGDDAATGFVMVDMVDKTPYLYRMSGATEAKAQSSAEGKVQHLGYIASFPIVLNIDGEATYFMTLKDNEGLIKQYAFVNVQKYSIVGSGESVNDAIHDYRNNIQDSGITLDSQLNNQKKVSVAGKITRISSEIQNGNTVYKFIIDSAPDKIFTASFDVSQKLALTNSGDSVSIIYIDDNKNIKNITSFDNLDIKTKSNSASDDTQEAISSEAQ